MVHPSFGSLPFFHSFMAPYGVHWNPIGSRLPDASIGIHEESVLTVSPHNDDAGPFKPPSRIGIAAEHCDSRHRKGRLGKAHVALPPEREPLNGAHVEKLATSPDQPLICHWERCGGVYADKESLVAHVNNDHVDASMDIVCRWDGCERVQRKPFDQHYKLRAHLRAHTDERPYRCSMCEKAYRRNADRKTHERAHTNERPYRCGFTGCDQTFTNGSDRDKHFSRVHSIEKRYKCPVAECYKRFTDPSSLRKHVKTNHGKNVWAMASANKKREGRNGTYGHIPRYLDGRDLLEDHSGPADHHVDAKSEDDEEIDVVG
ncbi:ci protein [Aphelenchoides avenae]|nr:ci protein [Aphelenchus avenae]